ncbi:alcohol dehydrogenase catalytic domain-containing protein, partial [Aeromicrobium sp. P5_D10]
MRATVLHGVRDIRLDIVDDPRLVVDSDAVVRAVASCVCGSDLWPYRGENPFNGPTRTGHELVGVVEQVGS